MFVTENESDVTVGFTSNFCAKPLFLGLNVAVFLSAKEEFSFLSSEKLANSCSIISKLDFSKITKN